MKNFLGVILGLFLAVGAQAQMANPASSAGLFPELNSGKEVEKRVQHLDAGMIRLIVDDVTIVNPPMNGISFCVGKLTVENQMNVNIQVLELFVKYGVLEVPVAFNGVAANGGKQDQQIAFAGENCKHLLSVPSITVRSCVAGNLNTEACQQRIKYIPIS